MTFPRRVRWGAIVTVASTLIVAYGLTGYPLATDYTRIIDAGVFPDVIHERATAWEAMFGDPYRPIAEILADHGYPNIKGGIAARSPGAFLLQLPLLLIPEQALLTVVVSLVLVLLFVALRLSHLISGVEWWRLLWIGPLFSLSLPVVTAVTFGAVTVLLPVNLILISWAFRDRNWAGVPLGVATASRLWPALIILGFWLEGRRRATYQAISASLVVTAGGLLLPGVTAAGTLEALARGSEAWLTHNQNASFAVVASHLGIPTLVSVIVMSLFGVWLAISNRPHAIPITAVAALLASPLSWPSYCLAALPAGALWWRRRRGVGVAVLASPFVLWILIPSPLKGYSICAALAVLLYLISAMDDAERSSDLVNGESLVQNEAHVPAMIPDSHSGELSVARTRS